jgi:DHA2 family multidrug resistance protein
LLRNEGGSVGTSVAKIIRDRREQFHTLRLNEHLDQLNPAVQEFLQRGHAFFFRHTGDAVGSRAMTLQALEATRQRQALSLAYFDVFALLAAVGVMLLGLLLLMRRSVAEKGAHVAAE